MASLIHHLDVSLGYRACCLHRALGLYARGDPPVSEWEVTPQPECSAARPGRCRGTIFPDREIFHQRATGRLSLARGWCKIGLLGEQWEEAQMWRHRILNLCFMIVVIILLATQHSVGVFGTTASNGSD